MDIDAMTIRSVDREMVRRLSCRSDRRGLLQLAGDVSLLCATGHLVWATRDSVWLAPAVMLHGVTLNFLFCPLHESIHRTAFASRWVNDWVARLGGALLFCRLNTFVCFISRTIASPSIPRRIRSCFRQGPYRCRPMSGACRG
jgi:fatty acid desaturase